MARKRGKKKATGSIAAVRRNARVDSSAGAAQDDTNNQPPAEPAVLETPVKPDGQGETIADNTDSSDNLNEQAVAAPTETPTEIAAEKQSEPDLSPPKDSSGERQPGTPPKIDEVKPTSDSKTEIQSQFANVVEEELKRQSAAKSKRQSATKNKLPAAAKPTSPATKPASPAAQPQSQAPAQSETKAAAPEPVCDTALEPDSPGQTGAEPTAQATPSLRWSKPVDYFSASALVTPVGEAVRDVPYKPVDYLGACAAPNGTGENTHPESSSTAEKTDKASGAILPASPTPAPESDQFWPTYESAAAAANHTEPVTQNTPPSATAPQIDAHDIFLTFEEASQAKFSSPAARPDAKQNTKASAKHDPGPAHTSQGSKDDDEGWIAADSHAALPKLPEPAGSLAEQVMKLAASGEQTIMPVAEASDSGTNLTESSTSNDSSDSWQPISKLVDPKEIKAAPPVSERSKQFIDNLRQSITKSGARELTSPERDMDDRKLSGDWRRTGEKHEDDDDDDEGVLQPPPSRQLLPPAPLRKQQTGEQKVTLEDRAIAENILPADFNEQQLSVKRLRDRTTGGKYHVYLAIYAICVLLAFATQRLASPEVLQVTKDGGQAVTSSVFRLMLNNAIGEFSNGLKTFEDESTRQIYAHKPPLNFFGQIASGWDAAGKTASLEANGAPVKQRRYWFSLPTGLVFGWPAAALYTVRQIFSTITNNKSGFELLLVGCTCIAVVAYSAILYMKLANRLGIPKFAIPAIVGVLMSVVSIPIWAVLTFSLSICKVPMPDTIEVFTALAVIIIAGVSAKFSFVAPKKRHVDPRLL